MRARLFGLALLATAWSTTCSRSVVPPPPLAVVRLTAGTPGAGFHPLGVALQRAYSRVLPSVTVTVRESPGAVSNLENLRRGDADIGFAFADVAYMAYTGQLEEMEGRFEGLRAIAVLQLTPLHLVVRSGLEVRALTDLRGRRVAVGPQGSGTALTSSIVAQAFGLAPADMQVERLPFSEAGRRLAEGTIDAGFFDVSYPAESVAFATRAGAHLVPIDGPAVPALRHAYPFLRLTFLPGGTYPGHPRRVATLGIDSVLVSRAGLSDDLVYALTKGLLESLPGISSERASLRDMEVRQAPATSVPLHAGAARYYRERELTR